MRPDHAVRHVGRISRPGLGYAATDATQIFAQLSLASQQAGVSWRIVWNKRAHYAAAFHDWDMAKVAAMTAADLDLLCDKEGPWAGRLMQNRAKLAAIIHNARQCLAIQGSEPGGLPGFIWRTVCLPDGPETPFDVALDGLERPLARDPASVNNEEDHEAKAYQASFGQTSPFSDALARRLRCPDAASGSAAAATHAPFKYLGSITLQAFMLQCGMLNGHAPSCHCNPRSAAKSAPAATSPRKRSAAARTPSTTGGAKRKKARTTTTDDVFL